MQKCDGERNQKNSHFRSTLNCILNFQENNTDAPLDSQRRKPALGAPGTSGDNHLAK